MHHLQLEHKKDAGIVDKSIMKLNYKKYQNKQHNNLHYVHKEMTFSVIKSYSTHISYSEMSTFGSWHTVIKSIITVVWKYSFRYSHHHKRSILINIYKYTRCSIITGSPNFHQRNSTNVHYFYRKISII